MKKLLIALSLLALNLTAQDKQNQWQYYFDRPATIWEESVPLGNGRIGMMPYGGVERERIVLNEISLWAGNKQDTDNPEAHKYLGEIRKLLFEKKNKEAQDLMYKTFTCLGKGSAGVEYGRFENLGNLYVDFIYPDSTAAVSEYIRRLDMNNAMSVNTFKKGGIPYTREYFTSFADDIGVVKYTSGIYKSLGMNISLHRESNYETYASGNILYIFGQSEAGTGEQGMKYIGMVKVVHKDGSLFTTDKEIRIRDANEVTLFISMATDYKGTDHERLVSDLLNKAENNYDKLKQKHIKEYQKLFNRVDITLAKNQNSNLPIDKRLEAFVTDKSDYDLVALYAQYGRYLLISSTREGGLPPNLQGLWAHQIHTPWNGDYHLNINLQMNLWGAEMFNLSELHKPLIEYTGSLVKPGEKTARIYYNSRGWVTHILGNVWGFTSPSESPSWGATNTAGAWLCQHLWEHYLYTQDKEYLRLVYPTMKGAAQFFEDMLIEDPNNGYLVTAPTTSPENTYIMPSGEKVCICAGSTMDNQIIRELFTNIATASDILNIDKDWAKILLEKRERLAPTSIGKHGQIMEWLEDYDEAEIHHRHVSQLYGLHPGYEMTYEKTPHLMEAAITTLNRRGDESTGWSMAWKINFWARLKDGERAFKLIGDLLKPAGKSRGTYPNLFSAHPPMQIDGNFGGSAGIGEMLLQSHEGYIELLPSIPAGWKDGKVRGMKARGGAEISFEWKDNKITNIEIEAKADNDFILKSPEGNLHISGINGYKTINDRLHLPMKKGNKVKITISS
ncbi:alpha-L-fucosidase 2 [Dysgonomonas hofstadii]|uniref:Alpha-L-fucosidase 2 n=1 Tax=Dysgonomonas hofstadii TaxID=637886 RepID=A0A840CGG3_9BACT|nr:glycoside hydrolase family 95 protein [Dysgonomonas hofstadii]MBB4034276.1 alpha-L-fucosidase 2 [Dysgonomonas hofstadii]